MKKLLLSFTLLFSFYIQAQTVASSCVAHDSIVKKYKKDANRLALRRAFFINSTYKDSVVIDQTLTSNYLGALLAVHNATLLPIRDTIINLYKVHTKPAPELNILTVKANSGNAWMQNLQNSVIPTGYAPIDAFIAKYHLQQGGYYQSAQYDVVVFVADSNYNIVALSHTAAAISSVIGADPGGTVSEEREISDAINPGSITLTYSYGWGTCNDGSGCDFRAYWIFKVYTADCKVEYVGHTGDAIPTTTVGIKENKSLFSDVTLYPNPAGEKLYVKTGASLNGIDVEILNTLGQVVIPAMAAKTGQEMDVSRLNAGVYYVKLKNAEGYRVFKLLKE